MEHHKFDLPIPLGTPVILVGVEPASQITVAHSILRGFCHGVIVAAYKERDFYRYKVVDATEGKYSVILIDPEFTVTKDSSIVSDRVRSQLRTNGIFLRDEGDQI
jgi:hypothetical protein